MAKKTVGRTAKGGAKDFTKVIKMIKTDKGSYNFREEIVQKDKVNDFLNRK